MNNETLYLTIASDGKFSIRNQSGRDRSLWSNTADEALKSFKYRVNRSVHFKVEQLTILYQGSLKDIKQYIKGHPEWQI